MNYADNLTHINERVQRISKMMENETNPHKRIAYRMVLRNMLNELINRGR